MTDLIETNVIFDEIGKQFGYLTVNIQFCDFTSFKIQWQRGHNWINFRISDYMMGASAEAIEDLAIATFEKIAGEKGDYGDDLIKYVKSPKFIEMNRRTYLKRYKQIGGDPNGEHIDLNKIYRRLVREGYLEDLDDDIYFTWAADDFKVLTYSVLMKVTAFSYLLDVKDTSDEVIEAAVYEAVMMIREGQRVFGTDSKMGGWKQHPGRKELDTWIDKHNMCF